ncbi:uncharacterized protein N7496_003478 [Penicillium cataractarum]|uniref:WD40 repeat-like protein n=1 Tax=Penicillium cataractarum TaxID=2100454 RepID=A0A9W9SMC9_9EURO|nr:uncharacterized protein N7496_003478 [Penicillium cataractarum]KAJ5381050.1 hypothetical protein N7496_003478 [Penicillium cataractarum]
MSHLSLYFTRGTPRSTTPAFTLDFSKEPGLESLAEHLYKQYTYGQAEPSNGLRSDHAVSFVTHGHTTFGQTELGWVPQSEVAEEQYIATPTFAKPKPTDIALSNGFTSPSSAPPAPPATPAPTRNTEPLKEIPAPVNTIAPPQGSPTSVNGTVPARETPTLGNTTGPPKKLLAPRVAPKIAPPISREKPTKAPVPTSTRQGDLRRSVALLNANRSQSEKTGPATQVTKQASNKLTEPAPPQPSDSQPSMSSSEYRPSSPSSQSSRSPTPKPLAQPISPSRRRSTRSRAEPATYNLKTLSRHQAGSHDSPHQSEREDTPAVSESPPPPASPRSSTQQRQSSPGRPSLQDFPVGIQVEDEQRRKANLSKLLWTRELRGARPDHELLRATVSSNLKLRKTWKGASNDVSTLVWSPDGTKFATGATAQSDEYNRSNNLLFGDLARNCLYELPDHHIRRESNTATADERLFPTVSTIEWVHRQLYTASFDHTVKIWNTDPLTSPDTPTCVKTLRHDSNVQVMSVSKFMPHLVATGTTHSFGLWNLFDKTPTPKPLEIHRDPRQKANIVLEPTTLAWGQSEATKNYLVGGMGEYVKDQYKVPLLGHLGMWMVTESSIERRKLSPDSQNIFDVKWHPSMRRFAIGSAYSQSMNLPLRSKSVVQLYDIESGGKVVVTGKCACSAVDMNEVTFCPMDSTYITASCTDGSTYVWDSRKDSRPIHKLSHGNSLNSLNPRYSREYTDFGVRVALWGTTIDQFYTGGSDGYLKQWDIRRSTQDALVANTVHLNDGITSGAFSADKSQLLLGDYSGGVHVLFCEHTEDEVVNFDFKYAPEPPCTELLGVPLAKELIASGKLTMDPIFGPVQGPKYDGPYAPWARGLPETTTLDKLKRTPLSTEYQLRQFAGPPVNERLGLDAGSRRELQCQFNLARARHSRRWRSGASSLPNGGDNLQKRKRDNRIDFGGIDKEGHASSPARKKKKKKDKLKKQRKNPHVITRLEESVIDLTMDSDSELVTTSSATPATASVTAATGDSTMDSDCELLDQSMLRQLSLSPSPIPKVLDEESDEDYWWPDSRDVDANLEADDL